MEKYVLVLLCVITVCMFIQGIYQGRKHHHHRSFGHKHGGSMLSVDVYAYASHLRKWNASFKVLFGVFNLIFCIAANNVYVSLAVIILMAYYTVVLGGLEFDHYISMMTIPIVFLIFGSIAIAVGFSFRPVGQYNLNVFNLFYIYCSQESLLKTANLIAKALGAVSALYMMTLTTPLSEMIAVFRKAHIPKTIVELMNMIYRYIFIMLDTQVKMTNSAKSRLGYVDTKTSLKSFGMVASNLFVVSLKKGTAYYNAMEARCYDGELLFLEEDKPFKTNQVIGAVVCIVFLIAIAIVTR